MVQVIALKPHRYAQRGRETGERYEARLSDLRFLERAGWARKAPEQEAGPEIPAAPGARDTKGRYRRRDMKADS